MKTKELKHIITDVLASPGSAFFYTPAIYKNSKSYLFNSPAEVIEVNVHKELENSLKRIEKLVKKGLAGYGYISYETGYLFERSLAHLYTGNGSLLKFCFCRKEDCKVIKSENVLIEQWDEQNINISSFKIGTDKETYTRNINKIKNYIEEGDTYQVNYTVKGRYQFEGSYYDLFSKLIFNQSSGYSAFINDGSNIIISLSPELFFKTKEEKIYTAPMKGTSHRGCNIAEDNENKKELGESVKNRAENLMIVDLLRNDLGRICKYGSVKVSGLFRIEKYESLYQKISEIEGRLKKNAAFADIIKNIFPCGSITGAPKIRTMEIINEIEAEPRGIYTGCIGLINKDESVFNVAIRTLVINKNTGSGEIGIGSGIVWDSDPEKEYDETLLKANFLLKPMEYFELFETMLLKNGKVFLLEEHLKRLKTAADYFLFNYSRSNITALLKQEIRNLDRKKVYRLRLILNKQGNVRPESALYTQYKGRVKICISPERISSGDKFRYFKTMNRHLYNEEYSRAAGKGFFDVIFLNERGEVCEGAITNIFTRKGKEWITPPLSCGLLPGVYRDYYLRQNKKIKEAIIYPEDLFSADEIILTNSLRGVIRVNSITS
jgi:para-aminobenzoate synthetase/4-amino-4-deoxychorismate lyase